MSIIQWFPGHMNKAIRQIKKTLKEVDLVIEVLDARIPFSSRNPLINELAGEKPRVLIFNKTDLADKEITTKWVKYYQNLENAFVVLVSKNKKQSLKSILHACKFLLQKKSWFGTRATRTIISGVPNVGKSTIINSFIGKTKVKVENKAGVTKELKSVLATKEITIIDTPGILWPKFEKGEGEKLAILGSIKDSILNIHNIACEAYNIISVKYPQAIKDRYKLKDLSKDPVTSITEIGKKRGFLVSGGEVDFDKTCLLFLQEIRAGILGNMSFETPEEEPLLHPTKKNE